jgi:hypothetical protein
VPAPETQDVAVGETLPLQSFEVQQAQGYSVESTTPIVELFDSVIPMDRELMKFNASSFEAGRAHYQHGQDGKSIRAFRVIEGKIEGAVLYPKTDSLLLSFDSISLLPFEYHTVISLAQFNTVCSRVSKLNIVDAPAILNIVDSVSTNGLSLDRKSHIVPLVSEAIDMVIDNKIGVSMLADSRRVEILNRLNASEYVPARKLGCFTRILAKCFRNDTDMSYRSVAQSDTALGTNDQSRRLGGLRGTTNAGLGI